MQPKKSVLLAALILLASIGVRADKPEVNPAWPHPVVLEMPAWTVGLVVRVEWSEDLVHWKTLRAARVEAPGVLVVTDHSNRQAGRRFYRASSL